MKKFLPVAMAALLAVGFTAFNSFSTEGEMPPPYYFQSTNTGVWHTYTGAACEPSGILPCQIENPLSNEEGLVQLYKSDDASPSNRVLRQ
jgi:hypothetical protein